MDIKIIQNIFKARNLVSLSIPMGIILATLFLPLPVFVQQAFIGIMLLWFFVELATGFPLFDTKPQDNEATPEAHQMKRLHFSFTPTLYTNSVYAILIVAATTALLLLIGRDKLGEAVIALLYLVPVVWATARWGQGPGMAAALTAALLFDFYFIPPFYTFAVGMLEGWLVLAIFLTVAIVVVGRIQTSLSKAQTSEREAIFMYELSTLLAIARTQEAVAHSVARFLQQRYLVALVTVSIQPKGQPTETAAYEPQDGVMTGKPDRVLALLNAWGLAGEIQVWQGEIELPAQDSRLFQNFASQIGQALERTRLTEAEAYMSAALQSNAVSK
ncbi:MAG: DUF4118 domain-containing protein [Anaerolineales bacterium]